MSALDPPAAPSSRAPHLLVVDDEQEIRDIVRRYFEKQGFVVGSAGDATAMRDALAGGKFDVVLLDIGLPGENGLDAMRYLRQRWNGAVIIVTGRGEAVDRIVGLELGADDYVSKPFDLRELLARVRSVLRRTGTAAAEPARDIERVEFAGYRLDVTSRRLCDPHGIDVPLTTGEFELLRVFLDRPNRVLSRDEILGQTHGRDAAPFDRTIDVQVGRLRRKIEADPDAPALIKSVRGAGYIFTARVTRG